MAGRALLLGFASALLAVPAATSAARAAIPHPELVRLAAAVDDLKGAESDAKSAYDRGEKGGLDSALARMSAKRSVVHAALDAAEKAGLDNLYAARMETALHDVDLADEGFTQDAPHPPKELPELVGVSLASVEQYKDELIALADGYRAAPPAATIAEIGELQTVFDKVVKALDEEDAEDLQAHTKQPTDWDEIPATGEYAVEAALGALRKAARANALSKDDYLTAEAALERAHALDSSVRTYLSNGLVDTRNASGELDKIDKAFDEARTAKQAALKALDHAIANPASSTAVATTKQALSISPIHAEFSETARATTYSLTSVKAAPGPKVAYRWALVLEPIDPTRGVDKRCDNHGELIAKTPTVTWHHGNTGDPSHDDGCDHSLQGRYGRRGLIVLVVARGSWTCRVTYKGTLSSAPDAVTLGVASRPKCHQNR